MKVLGFIRDAGKDMDAVQYYRTFLPLSAVNRYAEGIEARVVASAQLKDRTDADLGGYDIYTMCRMYHADCEQFIEEIHAQGAVLVLDSDDDLTEDYKLVSGRGPEFKRVLGMMDYVTVSTPTLAAHFAQYTQKPPTVLGNHVEVGWMREIASKARRIETGLTMGFIGTPTHWGDWRTPSVPLARIAREYDVMPIVVGQPPRYVNFIQEDMLRLGPVPFSVYPVVLKQFDIVLCAVDSADEFNAGKSAVKALECMALGIVPICSRFGPYMELANAGAPVVLVAEDTANGWYEAMRNIVTNERLRLSLSAIGPDWVKANRDMTVSGWRHWERFYQEIVENQGEP